MILFNSGIIIAGIPFQSVQQFSTIFWIIGGILSGTAIVIFVQNKLSIGGKTNEKKL